MTSILMNKQEWEEKTDGKQLMWQNEKIHPLGGSLSITVPDCKTGSVTKIVPESGGEGEKEKKGGLTSALADNASRAVGQL